MNICVLHKKHVTALLNVKSLFGTCTNETCPWCTAHPPFFPLPTPHLKLGSVANLFVAKKALKSSSILASHQPTTLPRKLSDKSPTTVSLFYTSTTTPCYSLFLLLFYFHYYCCYCSTSSSTPCYSLSFCYCSTSTTTPCYSLSPFVVSSSFNKKLSSHYSPCFPVVSHLTSLFLGPTVWSLSWRQME